MGVQVGWGSWHVVAGVWLSGEEVLSLGRPEAGLGRPSFPFSCREAAAFPERHCFPRRLLQPNAPVGPALHFLLLCTSNRALVKPRFQGGDPLQYFFAGCDAVCPFFQGTDSSVAFLSSIAPGAYQLCSDSGPCCVMSWGDGLQVSWLSAAKTLLWGGSHFSSYLGNVPVRDLFEPGDGLCIHAPRKRPQVLPVPGDGHVLALPAARLPAGFVVMDTGRTRLIHNPR